MAEREGEKGERWRERERSKDVARTLLQAGFPWRKRMEFGAQRPQMKLALESGFAAYKPWDLVLLAHVRIKWGKNG